MAARTSAEQGKQGAPTDAGVGRDVPRMTVLREVVAWLDRQGGAGAPYTEDHFRLNGRTDLVVSALLALLFVGSFLAFIAWLAATR